MKCTWVDCTVEATHPQTALDGEVWANLCKTHHTMMDEAVGKDPAKMLAYWIRAQGGARAAADRMVGKKEGGPK